MILPDFVTQMARYNAWQNTQVYDCADTMEAADRKADAGLFFGSVEATLNHLLWADRIWLSRFTDVPGPEQPDITRSIHEAENWSRLKAARISQDSMISDWAARTQGADLSADLTWFSGAAGREVTRPLALCITHFFNHQTHHRGQINAVLTAHSLKPGDTDLFLTP